jgi:hypothetical protein
MTGETKSGAQRACSYGLGASGLQGPGSAPYSTLLYWQASCAHQLAGFVLLAQACVLQSRDAYWLPTPWKPIGDRLKRPHYLSRVDHERKIRSRRQRADIGKYSFVNRTIQHWNQLPAEVLGILPCKPITFKKRVRKVIIELN